MSDVGENPEREIADHISNISQHKRVLQEQVKDSAKRLPTEQKRITVRRKFIWDDFKSAMKRKITPLSNLKVFFVGESFIDDGGPKRELFSGNINYF